MQENIKNLFSLGDDRIIVRGSINRDFTHAAGYARISVFTRAWEGDAWLFVGMTAKHNPKSDGWVTQDQEACTFSDDQMEERALRHQTWCSSGKHVFFIDPITNREVRSTFLRLFPCYGYILAQIDTKRKEAMLAEAYTEIDAWSVMKRRFQSFLDEQMKAMLVIL